jgi:hypothetical protein
MKNTIPHTRNVVNPSHAPFLSIEIKTGMNAIQISKDTPWGGKHIKSKNPPMTAAKMDITKCKNSPPLSARQFYAESPFCSIKRGFARILALSARKGFNFLSS